MRFTLVIVCMFLISTIVGPVFYHLWTSTGSINSNFFFALTLVYSLSQVWRPTGVCGCVGVGVGSSSEWHVSVLYVVMGSLT